MWTPPRIVCSVLVMGLAVASTSGAGEIPTCADSNPVTTINTVAKGGGASDNAVVSTAVTGNIIDAIRLGPDASRIRVCVGSEVRTATTDASGTATVTKSSRGVSCGAGPGCTIVAIHATQKYTVRSSDGADTDTLEFVPQ